MMEQPPAEFDVDAVGGVAERVGAQELQQRVEQAERQHADDDAPSSVDVALVDQHLVDDELEEDRRRQREHLHEQRGDDDLGERLAIAHDRGQEPAEAERGRIDAGAGEAAGDQHHRAAGQRRRFVERQVARGARRAGRSAGPTLDRRRGENGEAAGGERDQRRIGRRVEALGAISGQQPRLEIEPLGGAHEVFRPGGVGAERELVAQLRRVGGDAVDSRRPSPRRRGRNPMAAASEDGAPVGSPAPQPRGPPPSDRRSPLPASAARAVRSAFVRRAWRGQNRRRTDHRASTRPAGQARRGT